MVNTLFADPQVAPSFVALGDSFTEGLNDPAPGGGFRGWADRLAGLLAAEYPGLRYANLAVRGKLLREIVAEQVPAAAAMSPGLVSLAGGGNDMLRPGADPDTLAELFDVAVARLQADRLPRCSSSPAPTRSGYRCCACCAARSPPTTCTCARSPTPGTATWSTCGRCGSCGT